MDHALPAIPTELCLRAPKLADLLRAENSALAFSKESVLQNITYQFARGAPETVGTVSEDIETFGEETALVFFFDLHDYGVRSHSFKELRDRAATSSRQIAKLNPDHNRPMVGLVFRNFSPFIQEVKTLRFPLKDGSITTDAFKAVAYVKEALESGLEKGGWRFSFVLCTFENMQGRDLILRLSDAISGPVVVSRPTEHELGIGVAI